MKDFHFLITFSHKYKYKYSGKVIQQVLFPNIPLASFSCNEIQTLIKFGVKQIAKYIQAKLTLIYMNHHHKYVCIFMINSKREAEFMSGEKIQIGMKYGGVPGDQMIGRKHHSLIQGKHQKNGSHVVYCLLLDCMEGPDLLQTTSSLIRYQSKANKHLPVRVLICQLIKN